MKNKGENLKRLLTSISVILLLIGGTSLADCNDDMDEICIVFDYPDDWCQNCLPDTLGEVDAYVVLVNPSATSGLSGYEFTVCREGGAPFEPLPPGNFLAGYELPPPATSVQNPPEFIHGFAPPLPWSPCIWLLTIKMLIFSPDCWCFGVRPVDSPSLPGFMAYVDAEDPVNFLPMLPCTGGDGDLGVMACINCEWCPPGPPIATTPATWGAVKNIYR